MSLVNIRAKKILFRIAIVLSLLAKAIAIFLHEYTYTVYGLFSIKNKRATWETAIYACS